MWTSLAVFALIRLVLLLLVLLFLYPLLLLPPRPQWGSSDRLAASATMGTTIIIGVAHLLIPLKLFEWLGLMLTLVALVFVVHLLRRGRAGLRLLVERQLNRVLGLTDNVGQDRGGLKYRFLNWRHARKAQRKAQREAQVHQPGAFWGRVALLVGLAAVIIGAVIRLGSAMVHAGPAPSDYLEHLQWMHWLTMPGYGLFPAAVYPRGMNIVLMTLAIFSQEDPYLVLKLGGPLVNLLTLGSIWYFVRSATGSRAGALVATAVFALAPVWIPAQWVRQSAPLPQEFATAFLLPAAWWAYRYVTRAERIDLWLSVSVAFIVASTHWIALVYLAALYLVVALCTIGTSGMFKRTALLALAVLGGTLLGLLPQAVAILRGTEILGDVPGFVGGVAAITYFVPFGLGTILLLAIAGGLAVYGGTRYLPGRLLPGVLFAWVGLHYLPLVGVQSTALITRSWDFLAVAVAAALGGGFAAVEHLFTRFGHQRLTALANVLVVVTVGLSSPPRILRIAQEVSDEYTEQVLRLRYDLDPGNWMVVGRMDLLAMVLGAGQQVDGDRFAQEMPVPPDNRSFAQAFAASPLQPPGTKPTTIPDVYFFVEASPYVSDASEDVVRGEAIRRQNAAVAQWVAQYEATHGQLERVYRSSTLTIYRARREQE